jgi:hypothetical protein
MPFKFKRAAYLLYAGAFLFFLLYSTPHGVHHFFDSYQRAHDGVAADDHGDHDRGNSRSNDSNCVFQVAANRCHLGFATLVQFFSRPLLLAELPVPIDSTIRQRFLSYPFQVRAPPQV